MLGALEERPGVRVGVSESLLCLMGAHHLYIYKSDYAQETSKSRNGSLLSDTYSENKTTEGAHFSSVVVIKFPSSGKLSIIQTDIFRHDSIFIAAASVCTAVCKKSNFMMNFTDTVQEAYISLGR